MDVQVKNYVFNKTAKTVTFSDYPAIRLDSVRMIANVTSGIIIYTFANPALRGTVLNNVLTLNYDTSAMADTDSLQIIYSDDEAKATKANQEILETLVETLQELIGRLAALAGTVSHVQPAIRTIPLVSVSTPVTGTITAASLTNFGTGIPAKEVADDMNNMTAILANINNVII